MDFKDIAYGGGISLLGGMSAAGVGIGGGSLYLPVLIQLVGNSRAVPLAKSNSLAVSAAALLINIRRQHPTADRPLTNYDLVLLLEPVTLLGTICGVSLNVVLPSTAIRIWLLVLLCLLMLSMAAKGFSQYKEEDNVIAAEIVQVQKSMGLDPATDFRSSRNSQLGSFFPQVTPPVEIEGTGPPGRLSQSDPRRLLQSEAPAGAMRRSSKKKDRQQLQYELFAASNKVLADEKGIPWGRIAAISTVALTCYGLEFFSGGGLAFSCGTRLERISLSLAVLGVLLWTVFWCGRLLQQSEQWKSLGVTEEKVYGEQLSWGCLSFVMWLSVAFVAGLAAGSTGVSGGMVKMPFMIQMGLSPTVAAASSNFMVLFTSASTTFQYVLLKRIIYADAAVFGLFAFVGALLGQFAFVWLQERSTRQSFVTFWLSAEIGLSIICTVFSWHLTTDDITSVSDVCSLFGQHVDFGD